MLLFQGMIVVQMVDVPEFSSVVTQQNKFFESDEFSVKSLVISFNLTAAARMIRSAEDEFDTVLLDFCFEQLRDELFPVIKVDLSRNPAFSECPLQGINR